MPKPVPLIRAASAYPFLKWAIENRLPVEDMLGEAGLPHLWLESEDLILPFLAVVQFLDRLQAVVGPDVGCRVVRETTLSEIGLIGRAALSARSIREAVARVAAAQPQNTSSGFYSVLPRPGGIILQHGFNMAMPDSALHVVESYTASVFLTLRHRTKSRGRMVDAIEVIPHPKYGLDHLAPWFPCPITASRRPPLALHLADRVLDAPFVGPAVPLAQHAPQPARLHEIGISESTRILVRSMLRTGVPTAERMASYAGMSLRSYQRRLAEEGVTYSDLVEGERRRLLDSAIAERAVPLGEVAANLGYSRQSSLTRAVRRWKGDAPQRLRETGGQTPARRPGFADQPDHGT